MEVRRALEVQTARLAAERATEADIQEMKQILTSMEANLQDHEVCSKNDLEFHFALARATHNAFFEILLNPLNDALLKGIRISSQLPGIAEEAFGYHSRILEKVVARDGSGASREMSAHLQQSQRVTSQALKEKTEERVD